MRFGFHDMSLIIASEPAAYVEPIGYDAYIGPRSHSGACGGDGGGTSVPPPHVMCGAWISSWCPAPEW